MIVKDFYTIEQRSEEDLNFTVKLNPDHAIFKGHFPGNPIMPGVMMMQIVKELVQSVVKKDLQMVKCSNVKFMNIINPEVHNVLNFQLSLTESEDGYKTKTVLKYEDTVALKMNTQYHAL